MDTQHMIIQKKSFKISKTVNL